MTRRKSSPNVSPRSATESTQANPSSLIATLKIDEHPVGKAAVFCVAAFGSAAHGLPGGEAIFTLAAGWVGRGCAQAAALHDNLDPRAAVDGRDRRFVAGNEGQDGLEMPRANAGASGSSVWLTPQASIVPRIWPIPGARTFHS